jgi:ketosteroid isomerase-like protein
MTRRLSVPSLLCAISILAVPAGQAHADESPGSGDQASLLGEVQALDATFFDAYNRCDLRLVGSLVADDLEFYDDRDGFEVSRQALLDDLEKYICGKVHRELVAGTLEVHPIPGYGALEIGAHRFCEASSSACPSDSSVSKFVHIWRKKDGAWKLTRAVSYGHF